MKSNLDAIDVVFALLKGGQLSQAIDGKIYKLKRPTNSQAEDIVLNALPISPDIPQTCVVNVNVYVRNLNVKINGKPEQKMPDTARIRALSKMACDELFDVAADDYYFYIAQQTTIEVEEINMHYINIRISFHYTNNT